MFYFLGLSLQIYDFSLSNYKEIYLMVPSNYFSRFFSSLQEFSNSLFFTMISWSFFIRSSFLVRDSRLSIFCFNSVLSVSIAWIDKSFWWEISFSSRFSCFKSSMILRYYLFWDFRVSIATYYDLNLMIYA